MSGSSTDCRRGRSDSEERGRNPGSVLARLLQAIRDSLEELALGADPEPDRRAPVRATRLHVRGSGGSGARDARLLESRDVD